jgi:hypothetical protein
MGGGCLDPRLLDLDTSCWIVSLTSLSLYPRGKSPSAHWIGVEWARRAGLHGVEQLQLLNLPGIEILSQGRPARKLSLCRLRYNG